MSNLSKASGGRLRGRRALGSSGLRPCGANFVALPFRIFRFKFNGEIKGDF